MGKKHCIVNLRSVYTHGQLHEDLCFPQLSEAPTFLPPCPPAETAEINQCDLTDALIDTERTLHEEDREFGKIA